MSRRSRTLIGWVLGAGCIVLPSIRFSMGQKNAPHVVNDSQPMTADVLEREVRQALPMGSPVAKVEEFLAKRKIEFSYEASSKSVYAIARKLQGSTRLVSKSLQFQFHFDGALQLKSIDAKVLYTGP